MKKTTVKINNCILDQFDKDWGYVVEVGITEDSNKDYGKIDLAGIGMVNDLGSIKHKIPPRHWLKDYSHTFTEAPKNAEEFAQKEVEAIQDGFENNNWLPNAELTLEGGWGANKVSGRTFFRQPSGSDMPLISDGSLQAGVSYTIKKKESNV